MSWSSSDYQNYLAQKNFAADVLAAKVLFVLAVIAVFVLIVIWRKRRRIARSLDTAAVSVLATGVRAKRKIDERASAYRARVIAKASEPESRKTN